MFFLQEGSRRDGARVLFLGAVLFLTPSCALLLPEGAGGPPARVWRPGERLLALAQRERAFRSLRALARVRYSGDDGRISFEEAVLVQRPERLRLETLSSAGTILVVTVDGKEIAGFHPQEGLFYRGRSSKQNIYRYTRLPLDPAELSALLMGLPPGGAETFWREAGSAIRRDIGGGGQEVVEFDPRLGVPSGWKRVAADGEVVLKADFSDFVSTPAGPFPEKILLASPTQERTLEIGYQDPELNGDLPSSLFVQEKPASAREVLLESLGG